MEIKGIWKRLTGGFGDRTPGGWRTWGPGINDDYVAYGGTSGTSLYKSVGESAAMKLSAVWACMNIRAEAIGATPFYITDRNRNVVTDHWLESLIESPNADMTQMEFMSMATANVDMHGNLICRFERRRADKSVISLEPVDPTAVTIGERKSGTIYYEIGGEKVSRDNVLHLRGFSMDGMWGIPRLQVGQLILSAQMEANASAMVAFHQGLKVGGFFEMAQNLTKEQKAELKAELDRQALPENAGKWMALLKGMKPVAGQQFRVSPQEAQLLESRAMGTEEICRLFNTPPQLIYQTDKASSWASTIENINLFFLIYSLRPNLIRFGQDFRKQLLPPAERANLIPKFDVRDLMTADTKSRTAFYQSGLQNGYLCQDDVREMEDYPNIPNGAGQEFRVQLNMSNNTGEDK